MINFKEYINNILSVDKEKYLISIIKKRGMLI